MSQIRSANKLAGLEHYLNDLWQRSMTVAAFAYVLARTATRVNPDEAMLGGMMHGIGKLYVLTRAVRHPELFADREMLDGIIDDWHASIGKAILENWDFSEEMSEAIGGQDDHSRDEGPSRICAMSSRLPSSWHRIARTRNPSNRSCATCRRRIVSALTNRGPV